jgi:hypothetical protein
MRRLLVLTVLFHACERAEPTTPPEPEAPAAETTALPEADEPEPPQAETPAEPDAPAAEPAPPPDPYGPLAEEVRARFSAIVPDPEPSELTRNSHYWISNERSHFLWHEDLSGVGNAYVGVGTDQNYMLAAWAKSDLIILMDFDQAIVNLHRVYRVLFDAAETPEAFLKLWTEDETDNVRAMLEAAYAEEDSLKRIVRAHKIARKLVYARLKRLARQYPPLGIGTFVSDQAQYDHIRTLWANGRVIPMRGDLTADSTLKGIGDALRASDADLGVLYLSNAEQYFDYLPGYRRNIINLPFAERSLVVRTLGWGVHGFVDGEEYHYNRQSGANFVQWMKVNRVKRAGRILRKKTATETPGSSILDVEPEVSDPPPEIAP